MFYSLWEELSTPNFNSVKSHGIKINEVPYNRFIMTPNRWKKEFNAMGIIPSSGKYSKGTFAHPDIALEFASWIDPAFKSYLIKELERLKYNETYQKIDEQDYICLTDMAKQKDGRVEIIIQNWMSNRMTIEFLGLWEKINNPNFNHIEFDVFRNKAGLNSFYLTPTMWSEKTNALGIITKKGRYGGTYAHKDIAFEFASWLSPEFKLYLIKEFDRLKCEEQQKLGWNIKRNLAKINYRIHTNAIKKNLIFEKLSNKQVNIIYANEADVLNMALFGVIAKE